MGATKAQIGIQQVGIGGILKQYHLLVPPNQREYSWTNRQVATLFRDFAKAIFDEESEYFLGTIVTIPRSQDLLEVVDGQQRLATVAILLSEIRNYLLKTEKLIAESITNAFLTDIDRERRERVTKLRLNVDDNEFFQRRVSDPAAGNVPLPTRSSHQLIDEAIEEARSQVTRIVSSHAPKDHGDVLNRWITFVEHSAQVILLKVPSDVNAYKMFETLNDRGLRTSQADLVKNYLFGEAGDRLGEAQQKWARMRGTLESLEEEDITVTFLRHSLIAIRGFLRENEVYEAVQAQARGSHRSVGFLSVLEELSTAYVGIFNPEHEKWNMYPDQMRRAIQTLNTLSIRPVRPLMLAVASKFAPKEAVEAFQAFISWCVRLMVASSTRSGSVEETLAEAARLVFDGSIKDARGLKERMRETIPGDGQFRQAFEVATVSKAVLARYYLRSLEMVAKHEAAPWFMPNDDRQAINLEHVLPEKPEANWPEFDGEAAKTYCRRIGNLALLVAKQNSDLKSAGFEAKKEKYRSSPYVLTNEIAKVEAWGPPQITERQKRLAELALRAWPV